MKTNFGSGDDPDKKVQLKVIQNSIKEEEINALQAYKIFTQMEN